jgi:hypothetical protein
MKMGGKNDTGLLPIGHPAIKWLADRNHRIRSVSKKIFSLVNQKKDMCILATITTQND